MAANAFVKVVFGGVMNTYDHWSVGFAYKVAGGVPSAADMNGIAAGFSTFFGLDIWDSASGIKGNVNPTVDWSKCTSYYYPAGSAVSTVSGIKILTPDPGTNSASFIPPQCAVVVSLETGFSGRQNRGRVYLPGMPQLIANGQLLGANVDALATNVKTFLDDCNSASVGTLTFNACIGTGNTPLITSVKVDSVIDTQRRRRAKQVPSHVKVVAL